MTDATVFAIGCGVMFLFMAGAYLLARADYQVAVSQLDGTKTAHGPSTPA